MTRFGFRRWGSQPGCSWPFTKLVVLGLILCLGDGSQLRAEMALQASDSAGVSVITHPSASLDRAAPFALADEPAFRLGAVDGSDVLQLTAVLDASRLADGHFVIVDAGAVRVVDERGTFVRSIGRRGEGPGEFSTPRLVAPLPSSGIAVWDRLTGRLAWFDGEGDFEDSAPFVRQSVQTLSAFPDGSLLAVSDESSAPPPRPGVHMQRNTAHVLRVYRDGSIDSIVRLPESTEWELRIDDRGMRIRAGWYYPRLHTAVSDAGLWATDGTAWEVRRHDLTTGEVDRIVRFDAPIEPFTDADIGELHRRALADAQPHQRAALETQQAELDYPPMLPPIEQILVDGEGRLWIGRLEALAPTLPSGMGRVASRWIVLANEGHDVVGTVTLPPRRRLLHADREGVLTVTTDELDVPHLEWWPVTSTAR